jgi:hypothetical protein
VSDLVAFLIGAGAGILVTIAVLWQKREEVATAWQRRVAPRATLSHRRPTIAVHALAALGSVYVAVETGDSTVRAISLLVCLVAVASIGALLLKDQRSRRSP